MLKIDVALLKFLIKLFEENKHVNVLHSVLQGCHLEERGGKGNWGYFFAF